MHALEGKNRGEQIRSKVQDASAMPIGKIEVFTCAI